MKKYKVPDHLSDQLLYQEDSPNYISIILEAGHSTDAMREVTNIFKTMGENTYIELLANYKYKHSTIMASYHWVEKYGDISMNDFLDVPFEGFSCLWDYKFTLDGLIEFLSRLRLVNNISKSSYPVEMNEQVLNIVTSRDIAIEITDLMFKNVGLVGCAPEDILLLDMMKE